MSTPPAAALPAGPSPWRGPRAARSSSGNLTAVLALVAVGELAVSRVIDRLFLTSLGPPAAGHPGGWARLFLAVGPFLTNLCGILAIGLFAGAVVGLIRRGELFPRALRITTAFISLFLVALAMQGLLLGHLGERTFAHLQISSGFLSLLILLSVLFSPVSRLSKLAFSFLALPGLLHVVSVFFESTSLLRGSALSPSVLTAVGEGFLLLAGLALPLTTRASSRASSEKSARGSSALAWLVALAVTTFYVVLVLLRYDLLRTLALHGLRLELPALASLLGVASALSLACFVWGLVKLASEKGAARLMAHGALLVAVGGYQVVSPVEMCVSLVGLLAFATGLVRRAGSEAPALTLGGPRWRDFVAELASSLGDSTTPPETTIVEEGGREVSRIRTERGGREVVVRLFRRQGLLEEWSLVVGDPGHLEADASLARPTTWLSRGPADRLQKPRMRTGDPVFDRRLTVHGSLDLGDAELRTKLVEQIGGVLVVWKGRAARYVSQSVPGGEAGFADVQGLVSLLETILEVVESKAEEPPPPAASPSL